MATPANTFASFNQKGKKLSFADWIANLSPEETPFASLIGKVSIDQTEYKWQTDRLKAAKKNAEIEGSDAVAVDLDATTELNNNIQLMRKVVKVTDTANNTANYGRGKELMYQLAKAGAELKRDLEFAFLNQTTLVTGNASTAAEFKGFLGLVAAADAADPDTGAVVHKTVAAPSTGSAGAIDDSKFEEAILDLCEQLYTAGATANTIMFHPSHAKAFSKMLEKEGASHGATRVRVFENQSKLNLLVNVLVDPLGQEFKLVPNRQMPKNSFYFFNPADFDQMVFRAPHVEDLAKTGSAETKMIEMETGLRLRHPYAAGALVFTPKAS